MSANIVTWANENLSLAEVSEGLKITQNDHEYIATGFRLTQDVITFVNACIKNGLICAIRYSHPKPSNRASGVKYIAFSRRPSERFVCAIDQYSPKNRRSSDRLSRVIFEKHYRIALEGADIKWEWERSGGKNIFVPFQSIDAAICACVANAEAIEVSLGTRRWEATKAHIGFITESILEDWMVKNWKFIDFGIPLEFLGRQICHADILAKHKPSGTYVVFELKRGPQGTNVLAQLDSYLTGRLREKIIGVGVPAIGAVVAHSFDNQIILEASKKSYPIALFAFNDRLHHTGLKCILNWPPNLSMPISSESPIS